MHTSPMRGSGATILVVDDDALITLNMADQLSDLGYTAIEAYSGRDALALFQQHPEIDALITDFSMPVMTGIELAEAVRALRPTLPVLLITGYAELPEGMACTLPRLEKPFGEEQFADKVAGLLAAATVAAE